MSMTEEQLRAENAEKSLAESLETSIAETDAFITDEVARIEGIIAEKTQNCKDFLLFYIAVIQIARDPDGGCAQDQGYVVALSIPAAAGVFVIAHQ